MSDNRLHGVALAALGLVAGALTFIGCNNTPLAATEDLQLQCDFVVVHLDDERPTVPVGYDSVYAYFDGSDLGNFVAYVNGIHMVFLGYSGTSAVYGAHDTVSAGSTFDFVVKTNWRTVTNTVAFPDTAFRLTAPQSGSVVTRGQAIPISWTGPSTGTVDIELDTGGQTSAVGDTIWTETVPSTVGVVAVPGSVLVGRTDSTAIIGVRWIGTTSGNGFAGGLTMYSALEALRYVAVADSGTTSSATRPVGKSLDDPRRGLPPFVFPNTPRG